MMPEAALPTVSRLRLNFLRAAYFVVAAGLAATLWPKILDPTHSWSHMPGVVVSMLAAVSLLAAMGVFRPLEMLPILLFELGWKAIWLLRMALPLWLAGPLDEKTLTTVYECLPVLVFVPIVPWRYVWRRYLTSRPGREDGMVSTPLG